MTNKVQRTNDIKDVVRAIWMLGKRCDQIAGQVDQIADELKPLIPKRTENRVIHLHEQPRETGKNASKGITPKADGMKYSNGSPGWENAVRAYEDRT